MAGFSIYVEGIANRIVILDVRYERKRSISFQNVRLEQLEGLSCQLLALGIQCEKRPGVGGEGKDRSSALEMLHLMCPLNT